MKISFRAVATDLVSGKRVVMGEGSLAEALRASATVPILFNPIERDSMQLVDGGLVSNVPVDVAKAQGCDLIIVANTTSGLRTSDQMNMAWEKADQIMGIMMQHANQEQLDAADIVITPSIGEHLSSDFHGLDTLIQRGEEAGLKAVSGILNQIAERKIQLAAVDGPEARRVFPNVRILCSGDSIPDSIWNHIRGEGRLGVVSLYEIRDHVNILSELGMFRDVEAVIDIGHDSTTVDYRVRTNPRLTGVTFEGCRLIPASKLEQEFRALIGKPVDLKALTAAVEGAVRVYRTRGYSLARIDSFQFDAGSGVLHIGVNEGEIHRIRVEGGVRTQDWFVLRDFPLQEGEVFEIDKANQGITNINSTALFEFVYLEVTYPPDGPVLTIRLKERPSQLMRFGVRVDNERKLQGSLDMRDENFRGTGMQLGLNITGGPRNVDAALEFNARRLFNTYLTFGVSAFFRRLDSYYYEDAPSPGANQWEREIVGEYRDQRLGGSFVFGSQLERLGNVKAEFLAASVRVTDLRGVEFLEDHYQLRMIRVGTVIDTKNSYPFPIGGVGFNLSYEFALDVLGGNVSYNALRVVYESFTPILTRFTFHPRFTLGFADKSMPFSQEFRLGGQDNFFGLREDDRRGRQLLKANIEFRYRLPFRILWDAYVRARYDLATISDIPEAIKFTNLIHGVGGELAVDTPIGPALFAAGKSFYFSKDLPENPVQQGPWLFYFMIGYQI
jgi:NTE family protein